MFLRLGSTAFGGPAAHVAMMHDEVVRRRQWLDEQRFIDLLGATNLIPGPNSTEMAIHLGFLRARWPGLIVAGVAFILPSMLIVMALAWSYVHLGSSPQAEGLLYGVEPMVIVIVLQALWRLGRKAVKNRALATVGLGVFVLYLLGINEIALLVGGGLAVMLGGARKGGNEPGARNALLPPLLAGSIELAAPDMITAPFHLPALFFTFLKIGAVLYGSGYVLLAFLRNDVVLRLGWLTDQQLIDAVAIGQITPGPVFTTATFVGFLLGGVPGGLVATAAIFLPSFVFVAISNPLIPRLRDSAWFAFLLDGVNVASMGLMAGVAWQLGRAALVDPLTIAMALIALVLLIRFRIPATWLILAGAGIGMGATALR